MFSQSMNIARSSGMYGVPNVEERPEIRASVGLLYTVAVVDSDHGLGEGLLVEYGLDPEQLLPDLEALGQVEGGDDRHRFLGPVQIYGVLSRLHEDFPVLIRHED